MFDFVAVRSFYALGYTLTNLLFVPIQLVIFAMASCGSLASQNGIAPISSIDTHPFSKTSHCFFSIVCA